MPRARCTVIDRRKRQKPPGLRTIVGSPGQTAQLRRIKIPAQGYRGRHDEPPWFATLNLTRPHRAIAQESRFQGLGISLRARLETRSLNLWNLIAIQICVIGVIGLLLAVLHGIECGIWAAAYLWLGALDSPTDALLYSVDAMSTRGASGLTLQRPWQMMGALEAVNGMLLFGISTAYVFAVMQVHWSMLAKYVTSSQG